MSYHSGDLQQVLLRYHYLALTLQPEKNSILYPNWQHSGGKAKTRENKGAEGMCRSDPSTNKPSCWSTQHDAAVELQLTGGILHCVVLEFMYFANLISLD